MNSKEAQDYLIKHAVLTVNEVEQMHPVTAVKIALALIGRSRETILASIAAFTLGIFFTTMLVLWP